MLKNLGIDFIVCDHHLPKESLPPAVAVLDPKRNDCLYPYKELCGCGVGFKLAQALTQHLDLDKENLLAGLDLVAVATASDIVHLTGENRVIVYLGLERFNRKPQLGLRALKSVAKYDAAYTVTDLVFKIGPRINAAGRLKHAKLGVELFTTDDENRAEELAMELEQQNAERKAKDRGITEEALNMISNDPELSKAKSTVLFNETWHKGVIGIVASRVIEKLL